MKKGFTIVEVLVVIGIIAILTVIIFPSISQIRAKNRDTERVADIAAIQLALSLYYNKEGQYPINLDGLDAYLPADAKVPPNENPDYQYIYVPLSRGTDTSKCTYYHLGTKLELQSDQIDKADKFDSSDGESITNGYAYCDDFRGPGIDGEFNLDDNVMYHVRP